MDKFQKHRHVSDLVAPPFKKNTTHSVLVSPPCFPLGLLRRSCGTPTTFRKKCLLIISSFLPLREPAHHASPLLSGEKTRPPLCLLLSVPVFCLHYLPFRKPGGSQICTKGRYLEIPILQTQT
jgi:hypothetical protein